MNRLDDNLDAAEVNVNMGYRRSSSTVRVCGWLLASVMDRCSNRSLNMKLFAVLIFFLLFLA